MGHALWLSRHSEATPMTASTAWVTGLFMSRLTAERAVDSILRAGYTRDDVSVLMGDKTRHTHFTHTAVPNRDESVAANIGVGGLVGGSFGAVLAGIAAAGTAVIFPGIGLIVAGPIAAALAGAGAGSLLGAIIGAGIPAERAQFYHDGLHDGGMVVGVKATSHDQQFKLPVMPFSA